MCILFLSIKIVIEIIFLFIYKILLTFTAVYGIMYSNKRGEQIDIR